MLATQKAIEYAKQSPEHVGYGVAIVDDKNNILAPEYNSQEADEQAR